MENVGIFTGKDLNNQNVFGIFIGRNEIIKGMTNIQKLCAENSIIRYFIGDCYDTDKLFNYTPDMLINFKSTANIYLIELNGLLNNDFVNCKIIKDYTLATNKIAASLELVILRGNASDAKSKMHMLIKAEKESEAINLCKERRDILISKKEWKPTENLTLVYLRNSLQIKD